MIKEPIFNLKFVGKLKKEFSQEKKEIVVIAVMSTTNGKLKIKTLSINNGIIRKGKQGQVANSIHLYMKAFCCTHYWRIESPHTAAYRKGIRKYSDGVCLQCNTIRRKFDNYLPEKVRIQEPLLMIRKPKSKEENRIMLSFSSLVIRDVYGNSYKIKKGTFRR